MNKTLAELGHAEVLATIIEGIESEGLPWRAVKVFNGDIGLRGANLSGSGISIGLQSKGTALIQERPCATEQFGVVARLQTSLSSARWAVTQRATQKARHGPSTREDR